MVIATFYLCWCHISIYICSIDCQSLHKKDPDARHAHRQAYFKSKIQETKRQAKEYTKEIERNKDNPEGEQLKRGWGAGGETLGNGADVRQLWEEPRNTAGKTGLWKHRWTGNRKWQQDPRGNNCKIKQEINKPQNQNNDTDALFTSEGMLLTDY